MDGDDAFTSVTWDRSDDAAFNQAGSSLPGSSGGGKSTTSEDVSFGSSLGPAGPATPGIDGITRHALAPLARGASEGDGERPKWQGFLLVQVCEPRRENEGTKEAFISYGIRAETNLSHFTRTRLTTRRRFQDFVFLRDNLKRDFPACLVPPLPDKHRLEYLTGDRFSVEFIERRQADLQLFLERTCRHPTLQRAQLLRTFLESTEWHVDMHTHVSSTHGRQSNENHYSGPGGGQPGGLLDGLTDTLLNAFTKVRKPDEKYEAMKDKLERLEEGLASTERVVTRARARHGDLATDYEDLAGAIEGLGYLESGITDPLNRFAAANMEWSRMQKQLASRSTDDLLSSVHALLAYASSHRNLLRLRDQKQLDFEELTDYLSGVVTERDRLASLSSPHGAGHGHGGVRGPGIGGYLRDRFDSVRGVDEERTRVQRMQRLDGRINELQEAVTTSHDVSVAFSQQVAREHTVFTMAKEYEMKELLGDFVDGQIDMWKRGEKLWDELLDKWPEVDA
ncbi:Membrane coat complex Retromer, subunit VPS5/SNX1, Sorting nexins, and related PX domain-containing proteins [Ceraceosorus bombacis]|uniref:Sorting nexin-4 n=1 Tax=Ceraceosorus bombacis TaxID=401625 RepID=A0A0P1BQP1_9BASI|nr:Membrane coat complex Retromer, subunit VPS5/SNX1, Sorting nexins, and related PX domain-containing proteins [Ceraceosorus bombacis]